MGCPGRTSSRCSSPLPFADGPLVQAEHVPPVQVPFVQVWPFVQVVPQAPQFVMLVWVLTHAVPHKVCPAGHAQAPALQVWPVPQVLPHVPQLLPLVCVLTHAVPHKVCPAGQAQTPALQV